MEDDELIIERIELNIDSLSMLEKIVTGILIHKGGPIKLAKKDMRVPVAINLPATLIDDILSKFLEIGSFKDMTDSEVIEQGSSKIARAIYGIFVIGVMYVPQYIEDLKKEQEEEVVNSTKH